MKASLAIAFVLIAGAAQAQTAAFEFRGAQLGMTKDQWKALPVPQQVFGPATARCTDEEPRALWAADLLPDMRAAGIVKCVYVKDAGGYAAGQRLGNSELTSVEYLFRADKLYKISIIGVDLAAPSLMDALVAKYGKPVMSGGSLTTRAGQTVPQMTATWRANGETIQVASPSLRLDRFAAVISNDKAAAEASVARKSARGSDDAI